MQKRVTNCLFALLWLALSPASVFAQTTSPTDALLEELRAMQHLQGDFTQRQYTREDALLVESSGRFRLLRPGYFSWEITAPDSQLIVADPQYLWHHDRDLETVTRRPVTNSAQMSPLQVLGGDEVVLRVDSLTVDFDVRGKSVNILAGLGFQLNAGETLVH